MSASNHSPRQVEQLLQNLEDCSLTATEHAELMDLLRHDPEMRLRYLAHMRFAGLLHAKAETLAELDPGHYEHVETPPSRQFFRSALAAAAVLALAAYVASLFILPGRMTASIEAGPNTTWTFLNGGIDDDGQFHSGTTIGLEGGTLDLQLSSGSQLILEGPAELLVLNSNMVRMPYGRLWARAGGDTLTVHTKRLKVVDLGTEFGVVASTHLDEEVHVAEGRVRVVPLLETLPARELTTGEAVRANIVGKLRSTLFARSGFQTELPLEAPFHHWSFDEVVDGTFRSSEAGVSGVPISVYSLDDRNSELEPTQVEGRFGGALILDQPDQFAQADFHGIEGNLPRTVAFWVKAPKEETERALPLVCWGMASDFGTKWVMTAKSDGTQMSTGWGGAWAQSGFEAEGGLLLDDEWHHLAYVFTGRTDQEGRPELIHYRDGEALPLRNPARNLPVDTDCAAKNSWALTIGTQLFTNPLRPTYHGAIDELYVFRGALGPGQIRALFQSNRLEGAIDGDSAAFGTETEK